ncbi:MAG: VWA domain-containing protein [Gammaproteobacteria bacterium]|nr:VWA domain-containing protein [Gammaproteobacteria bacterium]
MSRDSLPFITHIILFGRKLHDAGIDVNPANLIDLSRSLQYIDVASRRDFYAAALATLIINREDMQLFTLLFNEYWDTLETSEEPVDPEKKTGEGAADSQDIQQERQRADGENTEDGNEDDAESEQTGYSSQELLAHKDIDSMTDEELEQARKIIAELIAILANRRSRRFKPAKSGAQLDFRKIFRRSMPYGEYCLKLAHRTHRLKKNKLILFCDVSGSMERYSRFLIQLICAMGAKISNIEVAVFSTRMTSITPYLNRKDIDEVIKQMSDQVHDWAGGTNIGGCLRELNEQQAHQMLSSHTIAVILSDGWDQGDADLMRSEMEQLRRRVNKIIWLNPLLGNINYQPLCKGMQTALPFLDYFLPVHNLESLAEATRLLRTLWH